MIDVFCLLTFIFFYAREQGASKKNCKVFFRAEKARFDRCFFVYILFDFIKLLCYYIIVKEKVKDMKHNRITRQLSQGRKQGYYKIKAKQLRLKTQYESLMLDFDNE